jgi:hypothetical protein
MYYYDTNSYYAGKVVQYVLDNLSKEGKFYYSFPYDQKMDGEMAKIFMKLMLLWKLWPSSYERF